MSEIKRDYSIDWLKTVGTLCLFLAHVDTPYWIKEIRGFDVPLMVFVSGLLAAGSLARSSSDRAYVTKRVERLVVPTWIFLVFFYICMAMARQLPEPLTIFKSFIFQRDGGIAGYTWIILVYLICSVLTPMLVRLPKNKITIIVSVLIVCLYEYAAGFTNLSDNRILYYTLFTIIPYGLFLLFSISYNTCTKKQKIMLAIGFFVFHIIYTIILIWKTGAYVSIGEYKYPARIYYFSYSIPLAIGLLGVFRLDLFKKRNPFVQFIAEHSLWIYLWHIFVLAVLKYVIKINHWVLCYVILVVISIGVTYLQCLIVKRVQRKKNYYFLKYFFG